MCFHVGRDSAIHDSGTLWFYLLWPTGQCRGLTALFGTVNGVKNEVVVLSTTSLVVVTPVSPEHCGQNTEWFPIRSMSFEILKELVDTLSLARTARFCHSQQVVETRGFEG